MPLSNLGSDDQLLTLVGTNLTIEDGNTIDLSSLLQTLNVTKTPKRLIYASGRRTLTANAYVYACGITRT